MQRIFPLYQQRAGRKKRNNRQPCILPKVPTTDNIYLQLFTPQKQKNKDHLLNFEKI